MGITLLYPYMQNIIDEDVYNYETCDIETLRLYKKLLSGCLVVV
jgi:hypothetical protein